MIRQLSILTLVMVLVGGVQSGHAQPRSSPPTSRAVLDGASELNKRAQTEALPRGQVWRSGPPCGTSPRPREKGAAGDAS